MPTPEERLADVVHAEAPEFVFFWKEPHLDPGCLSQWWPAPFVVDDITYPTAEHWMMAEKARLFEDTRSLERVLHAPSPASAKSLGRAVRGFSHDLWAAAGYDIVVAGNLAKFSQNDELRRFLAATGTRVLVEASPLDRVWGIGLAEDDEGATAPSRWRGSNLLGFALMEVRERL
ncbi:MAG TPA: NADAR family protein [Acidimicrobiales bacterium]|nr:NADAR family protein [Acidimicrobiales bacterium]